MLHKSYTLLRYFDDTWQVYISGQYGVLCEVKVALLCYMFDLSPLYEL